jgi:tetratricopeptide (TPR) repeat protein
MDPATLTILASIAGISAFIYVVLFGQRSLVDLVERRRQKQQVEPQTVKELYHELRTDFPTGYNHTRRLFDEAIEALQLGLSRQLMKILSETVQEETLSEALATEATTELDLMRSRLLLREGKLDEVAQMYEDILTRLSLSDRLRADALAGRARIFFLKGYFERATTYYEESIKLCENLGLTKERGRAYNYLGISYGRQGKFSQAIDSLKKSLSIAHELGDLRGAAFALIHAAYYSLLSGNDSIALGYCRGALEIGEKTGDKLVLGYANNISGRIYLAGRKFESAEEQFNRV